MCMFMDFSKRELVETGLGGLMAIIMSYLAMMGLLNLIV